ncbi:peroxin 11B [Hibiscus trionum]|uniref:Peroxin 11B n=1 Tax=Hibiscus trionum TaxID=183268 RepID=A0A9W7IEG9_HIBTR|nr:peroxin 11B [Hibiscus trionum]
MKQGAEDERKLIGLEKEEDSKDGKEKIRKIRGDRVTRLMAVAANVADLIIALAEVEPNPFCNHTLSLGVSGLVSTWTDWYRNWPS